MVVLFLMLLFFYGSTAYLYYINFAGLTINHQPITSTIKPTHFRQFIADQKT